MRIFTAIPPPASLPGSPYPPSTAARQGDRGHRSYLITEKGLNTFVKCNPTILGYEWARKRMDDMGYDYVSFTDLHF